jgi:DNA ligase-1
LRENFKPVEGKLTFAESQDSDAFEEIEEFLLASVRLGCEGLMIKTLETKAEYEPARRSMNWLKLKKDYLDKGLGDTFDLVPIGALKGTGKR